MVLCVRSMFRVGGWGPSVISAEAVKAAEEAAYAHSTTEVLEPGTTTFTATCKTCGLIEDEPSIRYKHPTRMALYAAAFTNAKTPQE